MYKITFDTVSHGLAGDAHIRMPVYLEDATTEIIKNEIKDLEKKGLRCNGYSALEIKPDNPAYEAAFAKIKQPAPPRKKFLETVFGL